MILLKDNKIAGISKELLEELNTTFEELGSLIDELKLKINSIKEEEIEISNKLFTPKKIEIISTENIEIFKLIPKEKSENSILETESATPSIDEIKIPEEETPKFEINSEPPLAEPSIEIPKKEESNNSTIDIPENTLDINIPEFNQELSAPELNLETPKEEEPTLNITPPEPEIPSMPPMKEKPEEKAQETDLNIGINPLSEPAPTLEPAPAIEIPTEEIKLPPLEEEKSQLEINSQEPNLDIQMPNLNTEITPPDISPMAIQTEAKQEEELNIAPAEPEIPSMPPMEEKPKEEATLNIGLNPVIEEEKPKEEELNIGLNPFAEPETSLSAPEETTSNETLNLNNEIKESEEKPLEQNEAIQTMKEEEPAMELNIGMSPFGNTENQEPQQNEEEEIELVFEDKLADIRNLLENSKELKQNIATELKKVSEELGIDEEMAKELYQDLLSQIRKEKSTFYKLIEKSDYENLHKTAHKLKGAALNLRISSLALILKTLDELSKDKEPIEDIRYVVDSFYKILDELENLNDTSKSSEEEPIVKLDELTKETLREYVLLGDEEKFQREKKFIEQLLNIKIKDLEEAKKLIKAN